MRKKIMLFGLLTVLGCFVAFIASTTNIFTAKKNVNTSEYDVTNGIGTDSKTEERQDCESEEKLDYEDDEYVVTSRERTYKSEDEHKKFRKKLQEDKESRPKTDDNILIYEN